MFALTELTEVFGCITRLQINVDKNYIPGQCVLCELRSYNGSAGSAGCCGIIALEIRRMPYLYHNDDTVG